MRRDNVTSNGFKFGFIELYVVYFSFRGERKVPKERPVRKKPTVSSLRIHHPYPRDSFALNGAKESDCAEGRQNPHARTIGGAPTARNSPLCFRPKSLFNLSDNGIPWVATKRATNRAAVTLTAVRLHGKLRLDSALASFAIKRKRRAVQGKGSLRKVPWVLSLSGALSVPFSRHGEKGT